MSGYKAKRIQLSEMAARPMAALYRLEKTIKLEPRLGNLVKIRASQLNGCAFCIDMHWKDARAAGEQEERLYLLDAWRESPVYDETERAALALCEAMTAVGEGHVPDEVWAEAESVFVPETLANLVMAITSINAWNRLMIAARTEPGHYQPVRAVA